jgi:acetyl esterase
MLSFTAAARRGDGRPSVAQARAGLRAFTAGLRSPASTVPVESVAELTVAGELPGRVYRPDSPGPVPTVVFFHGGGFVLGDLDTHDGLCRWICRDVGAVVLAVGYRLAPEAPFPAAPRDCVAATRWAADHVGALGGDAGRLAVAGDSAGGNLAAVVAQVCRDEAGPALAAHLLICPATDLTDTAYPSRVDNSAGLLLSADDMRWFAACYLGPDQDRSAPLASPLRGNLAGLPPAVVVTAEYDPLRDEGDAYAHALAAAGVPVTRHRFAGLIHGFFDLTRLSPACADAVRTMCRSLREVLTS